MKFNLYDGDLSILFCEENKPEDLVRIRKFVFMIKGIKRKIVNGHILETSANLEWLQPSVQKMLRAESI